MGKGLFECPGHIERVSDASTTVGRKKLGVGFAYITWSDSTASWQLLRPGYYGHHRAAGWRLPADGEDASLDETFEFEDDDDDGDAHSRTRSTTATTCATTRTTTTTRDGRTGSSSDG